MNTLPPPAMPSIEQWDCFELVFAGPVTGNPFMDVAFSAVLTHQQREVTARGFYDGEGIYRLRFMADEPGEWRYITQSNVVELAGKEGTLRVLPARSDHHGPVRVADRFHFRYADGTLYRPIGTTCYAWIHQGDDLEETTLRTLADAPFNKLRMCVFPKFYAYNENEPPRYPFETSAAEAGWDYTRFNPDFFQHLEKRILDLQRLGIEADLILFHPYDHWGFASMDAASDDRYVQYLIARLSAYHNVWWSLANEWDFLTQKYAEDWERLAQLIQAHDPYAHLRSIHNAGTLYDHAMPWVTHASIQHFSSDMGALLEWRERYQKPVLIDECSYEGTIPQRWGCLTAQEMVRLCWEGMILGGYVGHGETYLHPQDILWWSKGGILHGESVERIAFLKRILASEPADYLEPENHRNQEEQLCLHYFLGARQGQRTYLVYTGARQPAKLSFRLPAGQSFRAEIIDTWQMQITPLPEPVTGECSIILPGRPYIAVRLRRKS